MPARDSLLTRASFPTGVDTRIIQQINVDNEELACITYDLTWTASGPPTAEVLRVSQGQGQQHVPAPSAPATTALPEPATFLSLSGWNSGSSYAPYGHYVPRSHEPQGIYSPYASVDGSSSYQDGGEQRYTQIQYSSVLFS